MGEWNRTPTDTRACWKNVGFLVMWFYFGNKIKYFGMPITPWNSYLKSNYQLCQGEGGIWQREGRGRGELSLRRGRDSGSLSRHILTHHVSWAGEAAAVPLSLPLRRPNSLLPLPSLCLILSTPCLDWCGPGTAGNYFPGVINVFYDTFTKCLQHPELALHMYCQ